MVSAEAAIFGCSARASCSRSRSTFGFGLAAAVEVGRAGAAFGAGAAANFVADSGFFSSLSLNRREKKLPDSLAMLAAGPLACDEVEAATVPSRDGDAARAST